MGLDIYKPIFRTVGETGAYSATLELITETAPVSLLWNHAGTTRESLYSWESLGTYTVESSVTNYSGTVRTPPIVMGDVPYQLWLLILVRIEA
jgi:hypothetical protein